MGKRAPLWQRIRARLGMNHPYREARHLLPPALNDLLRRIGADPWNHRREFETTLEECFWTDPDCIANVVGVLESPPVGAQTCGTVFRSIAWRVERKPPDDAQRNALAAAMLPFSDHDNRDVRFGAVETLSKLFAIGAVTARAALIGALADDEGIAREAQRGLSTAGIDVVDELIELAAGRSEPAARRATGALTMIGRSRCVHDLPKLVTRLIESPSDAASDVLVRILQKIGEHSPDQLNLVRPHLAAGMSAAITRAAEAPRDYLFDAQVRLIVDALEFAPELLDSIVPALDDSRRKVRLAAVSAIRDAPGQPERVVPALLALIQNDETNDVRFAAARALDKVDGVDKDDRTPVVVGRCEQLVYFPDRVRETLPERIRFVADCPLEGRIRDLEPAELGAPSNYHFDSSEEYLDDYSAIGIAGADTTALRAYVDKDIRIVGVLTRTHYGSAEISIEDVLAG